MSSSFFETKSCGQVILWPGTVPVISGYEAVFFFFFFFFWNLNLDVKMFLGEF